MKKTTLISSILIAIVVLAFTGTGNQIFENNGPSKLQIVDLSGSATSAETSVEFYKQSISEPNMMGSIGFTMPGNRDLLINNEQPNGWIGFQTHGITKNMIDPNGWLHIGEGIRFGASADIVFAGLGNTCYNELDNIIIPAVEAGNPVTNSIACDTDCDASIYFKDYPTDQTHIAFSGVKNLSGTDSNGDPTSPTLTSLGNRDLLVMHKEADVLGRIDVITMVEFLTQNYLDSNPEAIEIIIENYLNAYPDAIEFLLENYLNANLDNTIDIIGNSDYQNDIDDLTAGEIFLLEELDGSNNTVSSGYYSLKVKK